MTTTGPLDTPSRRSRATLRFGTFELDCETLELTRSGRRTALRPQAARALRFLLERPGRLVRREALAVHLWGEGTYVDADAGLNETIRLIRRALGDDAHAPRFVETVPGRGYRFLAQVQAAPAEVKGPAPPEPASARAERDVPFLSASRHRSILAALVVMAVGTAVALVLVARSDHALEPRASAAATRDASSPRIAIALLGLRDLGGSPSDAWLSTALREMLISELEVGERLRLIPAARVDAVERDLALDGREPSPAQLGQLRAYLGADVVVSGSFLAIESGGGSDLRIDVRLQETVRGNVLATAADRGSVTSVFDVVSRLGAELRGHLGVGGFAAGELEALRTGLPTATEGARIYALGLAALRQLDLLRACDLLSAAARAAPRAAKVHSSLAACWSRAGYADRAREAAGLAHRLAAGLPWEERLLIEARHLRTNHRWTDAKEIYQALWTVFPDELEHGLSLAAMETALGRPDRALTLLERQRASVGHGADPRLHLVEAEAARAAGDLARQRTAAARAVESGRQLGARSLLGRATLLHAEALHHLGETERAAELAAEARRIYVEAGGQHRLAEALVHRLDTVDAESVGLGMSYEQALEAFRAVGDRFGEARSLAKIARLLAGTENERGEALGNEALRLARELDNRRVEAEALNALAVVAAGRLDDALVVERFEAAAKQARASGDRILTAGILANLAGELSTGRDIVRAGELAEEAVGIARHVGSRFLFAMTLIKSGRVAFSAGKTARAAERTGEALSVARAIGDERLESLSLGRLATITLYRGDVEEGRSMIESAIRQWDAYGNPRLGNGLRLVLANLLLEQRELDRAAARIQEVVEHAFTEDQAAIARAMQVELLVARGELREGTAVLRDLQPLAESGSSQRRLAVLRAEVRLAMATGHPGHALDRAALLVAESRAFGNPYRVLLARLELGRALMASGQQAAGAAELGDLAEEASMLGYGYLEKTARARIEVLAPALIEREQVLYLASASPGPPPTRLDPP